MRGEHGGFLASDPLRHQHTAVDVQRLTGDVFRLVGSEEQYRIGDVLRFAEFTQRSLRFEGFTGFFRQGAGHVGVDKTGGDAVDGNAAAADFARHGFGKTD